ncbi:Integrase core domain [Popillia japonica]|uniref:Integrase core domain n=1 Tax=Popillia japonica TaxID=7064 RepID=A0AAW1JYR7_POPJA
MKNVTASTLCNALDDIFVNFGLPQILVSDNGRQFSSEEFQRYCRKKNIKHITSSRYCRKKNIKHITSSPYHPKTNGLAERFVPTFKTRMLASKNNNPTSIQRLQNFIFNYRNTPHNTTHKSPNEMIFGHRLRTIFDNIKPDVKSSLRYKNVKYEI